MNFLTETEVEETFQRLQLHSLIRFIGILGSILDFCPTLMKKMYFLIHHYMSKQASAKKIKNCTFKIRKNLVTLLHSKKLQGQPRVTLDLMSNARRMWTLIVFFRLWKEFTRNYCWGFKCSADYWSLLRTPALGTQREGTVWEDSSELEHLSQALQAEDIEREVHGWGGLHSN